MPRSLSDIFPPAFLSCSFKATEGRNPGEHCSREHWGSPGAMAYPQLAVFPIKCVMAAVVEVTRNRLLETRVSFLHASFRFGGLVSF